MLIYSCKTGIMLMEITIKLDIGSYHRSLTMQDQNTPGQVKRAPKEIKQTEPQFGVGERSWGTLNRSTMTL